MARPLDTFSLGGLFFDGFSTPAELPFGGKQQMHVHKLPGGSRVIDCMGPDDEDRHIKGTFYGSDALAQALTLDAIRRAGAPIAYTSGVESRSVVISDFRSTVERYNVVHFDATLVVSDGGTDASAASTPDTLIGSDLQSGQSVVTSNLGQGGIGHA